MRATLARLCAAYDPDPAHRASGRLRLANKGNMDSLDALLSRLFTLHRKTIELSLGRIERLLAALGSPGIAAAADRSCRRNEWQGFDDCFLCEPFWKLRESASMSIPRRIWCAFMNVSGSVRKVTESSSATPSFLRPDRMRKRPTTVNRSPSSKSPTAAAFKLFSEHPADYLLLEVGLGGRFDANQCHPPAMCHGHHAGLDRSS